MVFSMWDEKTFGKFVYLSDIRVSPKGLIAYVLTKVNFSDNKYENTIVIEQDGLRKFVKDALMPRFSPDGRRLTYVKRLEDKEKFELYVCDIDTLSSRKIMETKTITDMDWNRDGRKVLISSIRRRDDPDLWFEDDIPVWFDNKGFLDGEEVLLQVLDIEAGEVLDTFTLPRFSTSLWCGDKILSNIPKRNNPYKLYDIVLLDGKEKEFILRNVSFKATDVEGKKIVLLGKPKKKSIMEHNFVYLYDKDELVSLTEDFVFENADPKIDRGKVYFKTYKRGKILLEVFSDGEKKTLVKENGWVTYYDVKDGLLAYILMSDINPGEVYIFRKKNIQLTNYNREVINKLKLLHNKYFAYESFDGTKIDGWYLEPDNKKTREKAPMIVFVHGGPKGMYGYRFSFLMQLLAKNGFYVVFVNPRGSGGYDEKFALKVVKRTGLEDFKDIMEGVKWFINNKDVDPKRIGITGISYGGFMTNWAITQTNIFKAAVSENGISYWFTSFAFSDIGLWFDREIIGSNPFRSRNFRKLSPIFYATNVVTPVLFIHSLEDYRCPLDQSVMFYHVLKDMGKEAYILIFKKGAHGHSIKGKPIHRAKRYKVITEFFKVKLAKKPKRFNLSKVLKDYKSSQ